MYILLGSNRSEYLIFTNLHFISQFEQNSEDSTNLHFHPGMAIFPMCKPEKSKQKAFFLISNSVFKRIIIIYIWFNCDCCDITFVIKCRKYICCQLICIFMKSTLSLHRHKVVHENENVAAGDSGDYKRFCNA